MARSIWKGYLVDTNAENYLAGMKAGINPTVPVKVIRGASISPEYVGVECSVHNGKNWVSVRIFEDMIGHKFGEFAPTRKFPKHPVKNNKNKDSNKAKKSQRKK